jgi:site-specific DNA recombinase
LSKLIEDLDTKRINTKRRAAKTKASQGGSPFSYGPLAYMLRNRIYLGETGHHGKWYPGEHEAIIDQKLFDDVQAQFANNSGLRAKRQSESGALLMGKLYDDRGNVMTPSYSTKNGVRYRFYVSSALLKGRKANVGSVGRVSAADIEKAVINSIIVPATETGVSGSCGAIEIADRIEKGHGEQEQSDRHKEEGARRQEKDHQSIEIAWSASAKPSDSQPNNFGAVASHAAGRLLQAIVRARAWIQALKAGDFSSVEALAKALGSHPKIVRQQMRFAFLNPRKVELAIAGEDATPSIPRLDVPLTWKSD